MHFLFPYQLEARAREAVADLERLPEMLIEPLKAKLAEGEIVKGVIVEMRRILACRLQRLAAIHGPIKQQHRLIMHAIHCGEDAEEMTVRLERGANLPKDGFLFGDVRHYEAVHRHSDIERPRERSEV